VPKLTGTPGRIRRAARWTVGADTEDVLGGIGVEDAELATLREDGIV
jgi:crotonobetainyl-CoA:carnitine CoA-transferase CaiB-like acyl-CoA transferase